MKISLRKFLILLSVLLLAAVLLVVSFVLYSDVDERLKAQTAEIGTIKFRQYMEYVDGNFSNLNKLVNYIIKDNSFNKILSNNDPDIMSTINKRTQIEGYLAKISSEYDFISSINIISSDKKHYYYGNIIFSNNLINQLDLIENNAPVYSVKNGTLLTDTARNSASYTVDSLDEFMYMYFQIKDNSNKTLNVWIVLNRKMFFRDKEDMESTAFYDRAGVVYKGLKMEQISTDLYDSELFSSQKESSQTIDSTRIYSQRLSSIDLTGLYAINTENYIKKLETIRKIILLIYIFSLGLAFAASEYISGKIIKPIDELNSLMSKYNLAGVTNQASKKKAIKKFSLREKIFYYLLITILIPVAFYMLAFSYQSGNVINEMVKNYYESVYEKTSNQLNRTIENKISLLQKLSFDSSIQNYLVRKDYRDINDVEETVEHMRYLGLNRDMASLYDNRGNLIFSDRYVDEKQNTSNLEESLKSMNLGVSSNIKQDQLGDKYLSICMPVIYLESSKLIQEKIGFCRVDIEYYRLDNIFSILKDTGCKTGITDASGNLVFDGGKRVFEKQLNLGEKDVRFETDIIDSSFTVYGRRVPGTSLYLLAWFNTKDIEGQTRSNTLNYIYLFVVILLVTVIISHFISLNLLKPVGLINNLFKSYDIYESNVKDDYFIDEINSMSDNFNQMADRIETLVDDLIIANNEKNKVELERKSAEITALQAQINPHFLYNTLNNLIALIRTGSYDEAVLTVKLLSRLFKYGISREDIIIPVREEIEYAKAYTQIMKIRHRDRISFEWDIQEEALDCMTVKLILQPLIENSVRHGFNTPDINGKVTIRCRKDDTSITFEVEDNGEGIEREELEDIRNLLAKGTFGNRIGIFNVQSRLKLHYGKQYGLTISSISGEGTLVSVKIPIKYKTADSTLA